MKALLNGQIYILGDNIYALSMIFESISLVYGVGTTVKIVINRPYRESKEKFDNY